jgi:hypothetical protein
LRPRRGAFKLRLPFGILDVLGLSAGWPIRAGSCGRSRLRPAGAPRLQLLEHRAVDLALLELEHPPIERCLEAGRALLHEAVPPRLPRVRRRPRPDLRLQLKATSIEGLAIGPRTNWQTHLGAHVLEDAVAGRADVLARTRRLRLLMVQDSGHVADHVAVVIGRKSMWMRASASVELSSSKVIGRLTRGRRHRPAGLDGEGQLTEVAGSWRPAALTAELASVTRICASEHGPSRERAVSAADTAHDRRQTRAPTQAGRAEVWSRGF